MINIWIKPHWPSEAKTPLILGGCSVCVTYHTHCHWLVWFQGSGMHYLVFICFGAKCALAAHRKISSGSKCNKGLVPASSAVPRVWPQISRGHLLQQEWVKLSLNLVFASCNCLIVKILLTSTCKLAWITLAKWEIRIVCSATVDWFVFLAYSIVIFKLSATSKLDSNENYFKLACKIQLNHCVSYCICILRIVTKIGVNAIYYYRIMTFLESFSWWKINKMIQM